MLCHATFSVLNAFSIKNAETYKAKKSYEKHLPQSNVLATTTSI